MCEWALFYSYRQENIYGMRLNLYNDIVKYDM
jgi:hypothetical protein